MAHMKKKEKKKKHAHKAALTCAAGISVTPHSFGHDMILNLHSFFM